MENVAKFLEVDANVPEVFAPFLIFNVYYWYVPYGMFLWAIPFLNFIFLTDFLELYFIIPFFKGCGSAFISSGSGSKPDPGLNDQKLKKKITAENFLKFFWIKNYNLPVPRPP
jgi:hypothetical protein